MRSLICFAPLLAAISSSVAQHVDFEPPEVIGYVESMLGEFRQCVNRLPTCMLQKHC